MSTIFIAVVCCQCSTMQVKRSSKTNKWKCVVCNQKQSVRQVFAQGPMARDLRPFVQSSNMARQRSDQTPTQQRKPNSPLPSSIPYNTQNKRPTDWTKYLDSEDYDQGTNMKHEYEEGCGFEPEIVTELPAELFEEPKLNKSGGWSESDTRKCGVDAPHNNKPVFSKRHFNKHVVCPEDEKQRKDELTIAKDTPKLRHFMTQEARTCQATEATLTLTRGASTWNDYINQDEDGDDDLRPKNRWKRAYNAAQENADRYKSRARYEYETAANDEKVEDDIIHPDFL